MQNQIQIDEEKCVGCGLCANTCHQGVIGIVDGKAKLLREDYCDGLGRCLPVCPTGAISFAETKKAAPKPAGGCPGSMAQTMETKTASVSPMATTTTSVSQLRQWPVQIQLVPVNAPYFDNANLLVAADCAAYAYGGFHDKFMKNRVTIIGCPKLDPVDYAEKLTAILTENPIKSVTIARMEVPCCGGIEQAVKTALKNCGKLIPWQTVTISIDGNLLEDDMII